MPLGPRKTIYDVAARAGVSVATASKALNDTGRMSEATRERVKAAAVELNFRPNVLARNLSSRYSRTIGVLTDDTYGRFTLPVMAGVSEALIDHGVTVFLCALGENPVLGQLYLDALFDKQVDGLIATGKRLDRPVPVELAGFPMPVVYVLTQGPADAVSLVPDDRGGAALAVRHLVERGCRRIAHITGPADFLVVDERAAAYREVLGEAGLPVLDVLKGKWNEHWGHEAVAALFDAPDAPDGIFCGNDQIARGVVDALRDRGLGVPQDVAVVGFDNWEVIAVQSRPPITSIDLGLKQLGQLAGLTLLKMINGEAVEPGVLRTPCTLEIRGT